MCGGGMMAELKEHGIEEACYSNGPYGFRPRITCECGWTTTGDNWAQVGEDFDDHLKAESSIPVEGSVS